MQREESRGLVLRAIDYKQRQRIITVLTEDRGIISLMVKGLSKKQSHLFSLTSPFSVGEFHYTIHRSDLYYLRDASLISSNLELRGSLKHMQAAGEMCQALLTSQMPGKAAPLLFQLAVSFLKHIPLFEDPSALVASFLLKLLKHEGLLSPQHSCTHCDRPPRYLIQGEALCIEHAPYAAHALDEEEWEQFFILLEARDFGALKELKLSSSLSQAIRENFNERFIQTPVLQPESSRQRY